MNQERTFNVSESFIKEAYSVACSAWKIKLEEKFPEVFKLKLVKGEWYKLFLESGRFTLFQFNGDMEKAQYGFGADGDWCKFLRTGYPREKISIAPTLVVRSSLENEANKRGFKKGVKFICVDKQLVTAELETFDFWNLGKTDSNGNKFNMSLCTQGGIIYREGVWAKIVKEEKETTPTEDEIERVLKYLRNNIM